ncbi:VOC family protein [Streptomyces sp. 8N114]|uniref:VOC family protein n=1 Tax=Streptomyces sp. 8N114 TaxID=3457419 RepID=UPI003FD19800
MNRIDLVTLLVEDYDEALAFYVGLLGFTVREDTRVDEHKRWVVVDPPAPGGTGLLLARAVNPAQRSRVGDQTGGRVGFFLSTSDFAAEHARLTAVGVHFEEVPREEPYGTVAVFRDLYGNRWDLIQHR